MLDEFDLAGLNLSEEEKNQIRELDADMDRIISLLSELNKDKLNDLMNSARDLAEINPFNIKENKTCIKSWEKSKFYE